MDSTEAKRTPVFTVKAVSADGNQTILYPAYGPVRIFELTAQSSNDFEWTIYVPTDYGANMELNVGGTGKRSTEWDSFPAAFSAVYVTDGLGHTVQSVKASRHNAAHPANRTAKECAGIDRARGRSGQAALQAHNGDPKEVARGVFGSGLTAG